MTDYAGNDIRVGDKVVYFDADEQDCWLLTVRQIHRPAGTHIIPGSPISDHMERYCIACSDGGEPEPGKGTIGKGFTKAVWAEPKSLIVIYDIFDIHNAAIVFTKIIEKNIVERLVKNWK